MIPRSFPAPPNIENSGLKHGEQLPRPASKLRTLLGRFGLLNTPTPQDVSPMPEVEAPPQVDYSRESLEQYLRQADILGTDRDPSSTYMAAAVKMLPKLDIPPELSIIHVTPDNTQAADDFRLVAAQNLAADHCPAPYANPNIDESKKSYYVGYVTLPGRKPIAATTLEILDYEGKGNIARLDNVSTLASFRGHNYAGALISNILSQSDYTVAFLDSTPAGKGLYEHLGFFTVG